MNGLALNALHDKAFEVGLITIDADSYTVRVSPALVQKEPSDAIRQNFMEIDGKEIILPGKFLPDRSFLRSHNELVFRG